MQNPFVIDITDSEFYENYVLIDERPLAVVLKKNLATSVLVKFAGLFKLIDVEYEGETHFGIAVVIVRRRKPGEKSKARVLDPWGQ